MHTPSSLFVWDLLKSDISKAQIVDAMAVEYDAPRDVLESDVEELIDSFRQNSLLDE